MRCRGPDARERLIAEVPPELGLGYGLGDAGPVAVLFAAPAPGIVLGGSFAGWLATRIGPARTLLGGIAIGTVATFTMLVGVSSFPLAVVGVALLGMAAGAIGTSGFNLATALAPPERHGVVSGLVSVMLSLGGVVVTVASTAVLNATATVVDGAPQNSATGVYLYVLISGILFALATVTATVLVGKRFGPRRPPTDAGSPGPVHAPTAHRAAPSARHRRAPTPPAAGGGVKKPVQRLAVGICGVLFAGMALFFATQIVTAGDGTALLGSRQVDVGPDQERVQVGALFGNVDVVVPEGVHVRLAGRVAFGGTECERACSEPGREIEVNVVGAFAMVDVMRPGEVLADEREDAREDAEDAGDAAEDARERAEEARDGG